MSKRAGEFITLDELLAEIGVDAARWFFACRGANVEHRLRHRAGQEAVEREPGLLRPVRARADRLDPAQGGRGRAWPRRRSLAGRAGGGPGGRAGPDRARLPEVVEDAAAAQETQGVTPSRPSWRRPSTPSTATRRSWTRPIRSARRGASPWSTPRASPWPNALALLGISAPDVDVAGAGRHTVPSRPLERVEASPARMDRQARAGASAPIAPRRVGSIATMAASSRPATASAAARGTRPRQRPCPTPSARATTSPSRRTLRSTSRSPPQPSRRLAGRVA